MITYQIVMVGRVKQPHFLAGAAEYEKRLRPYARVVWSEVEERPLPKGAAPGGPGGGLDKNAAELRRREGEELLRRVPEGALRIALDPRGDQLTSEQLAEYLARQAVQGFSTVAFLIGGTVGLDPAVLQACHRRLSLSALTFPHQMVPLILLEQLYRAAKIQAGEPYHW